LEQHAEFTEKVSARLAEPLDGRDGASGPAGERGERGQRGESGERGQRGEPGIGRYGQQGERGQRREIDPRGEKGDPGCDGCDHKDADPEIVARYVSDQIEEPPRATIASQDFPANAVNITPDDAEHDRATRLI
jgi:hypothetical protein